MFTASRHSLNNMKNKQAHRVVIALQTRVRDVPSSTPDADVRYVLQLPQRNIRIVIHVF